MKKSILLLLAACLQINFATSASAIGAYCGIEGANIKDFNCNLPAPASIQVLGSTSTTITVQWAVVPGAVNYRVLVTPVNGSYTIPLIYTALTQVTVTGLQPGTEYFIAVSAGCGGGQYSPLVIEARASTEFIIDLVINGYQSPGLDQHIFNTNNNNVPFPILLNQCYHVSTYHSNDPSNAHTFYFVAHEDPNIDGVYVADFSQNNTGPNNPAADVMVTPQGNTSLTAITKGAGGQSICSAQVQDLLRAYIATCSTFLNYTGFKFSSVNTAPIMTTPGLLPGYEVKLRLCGEGSPNGKGNAPTSGSFVEDRNDQQKPLANAGISVSPNPFQEKLQVNIGELSSDISDISLDLFDLSGKLHRSTTLPAAETLALDTEGLPVGMYFLRVKVGETVRVLKAVKGNQ